MPSYVPLAAGRTRVLPCFMPLTSQLGLLYFRLTRKKSPCTPGGRRIHVIGNLHNLANHRTKWLKSLFLESLRVGNSPAILTTRDRRISITGQIVAKKLLMKKIALRENHTANALPVSAGTWPRRSVAIVIKEAVFGRQFLARLSATGLIDFISVMNLVRPARYAYVKIVRLFPHL